MRAEVLVVAAVMKEGKRIPRRVETGRMMDRMWPRRGVGREN
jgi:hypothetical protein